MKNIYEIFDEFESAKTKEERNYIIQKNINKTLYTVLLFTFHPDYQWKIKEMPEQYKVPDTLPGVSFSNMSLELRRLYLFREGDPKAEEITDKRREEILIQLLESLEPREAEVVMGIFNKDQGVKNLTYKYVKEIFPDMLP